MILPDIILLKDYPETRKFILEHTEICSIAYSGMAFEQVNIDSVCLACRKRPSSDNTKARVQIIRELTPEVVYGTCVPEGSLLPQRIFWELDGFKFNIHLDPGKLSLLKKFDRLPRFGDVFEAHEGIHSGNVRGKLFLAKRKNRNCRPLVFGRDEIDRFYLSWKGMWVNYDTDAIDRALGEYANLSKAEFFESPKIFIRRTGDYVMAVPDDAGFFASNNLFVLLPKATQKGWDLGFVCGLLNSRLMTWFFRTIQPRVGKLFAELKINHIAQFPLPFKDPAEGDAKTSSLAQKVSLLVERMIELNKQKHSGAVAAIYDRRGPGAEHSSALQLDRDIASTDAEIDELVYELYGITDDERKIIEGA